MNRAGGRDRRRSRPGKRVALHHMITAGDRGYGAWRDGGLHDPRHQRSGEAEAALAHQLVAAVSRRHAHAAAAARAATSPLSPTKPTPRQCAKGTFHTFVVDVRAPENPVPIATLPTPKDRDFCGLGHVRSAQPAREPARSASRARRRSSRPTTTPACACSTSRTQFAPKEIASWVPPAPKKLIDPRPNVALAAKTADIYVTTDGLIYRQRLERRAERAAVPGIGAHGVQEVQTTRSRGPRGPTGPQAESAGESSSSLVAMGGCGRDRVRPGIYRHKRTTGSNEHVRVSQRVLVEPASVCTRGGFSARHQRDARTGPSVPQRTGSGRVVVRTRDVRGSGETRSDVRSNACADGEYSLGDRRGPEAGARHRRAALYSGPQCRRTHLPRTCLVRPTPGQRRVDRPGEIPGRQARGRTGRCPRRRVSCQLACRSDSRGRGWRRRAQ